ncbi:MAG TPA: hypothetical protein VMC09_13790, partial [Anaerolineales bacterium]|nr:hypothetical protein [Anaerolineales bacterium]
ESSFGIICVTPENLNSLWIQFEAGALSNSIKKAYVCPYLFGMEKKDFTNGPLAFFQAAKADKTDTRKLLMTINAVCEAPLGEKQFDIAFRRGWPELDRRLKKIPAERPLPLQWTTMRGLSLSETIERVGLTDIENRDDQLYELPPNRFYEQAKREVFIAGPSLYMTFLKHVNIIHSLLATNKQVYIMILHPDSEDIPWLTKKEKRGIRDDIKATLRTIKEEGLLQKKSYFHIRFVRKVPPFIGVMIDGDISPKSAIPIDIDGQVRIQPNNIYVTGHKGLIIQLKKIPALKDRPAGPFDFFSSDFRQLWTNDAKEYPIFFKE